MFIMENGRRLPNSPNGWIFDCHCYCGPNPDDELFGMVRYFNTTGLDLNNDIGVFNGYLKVAKMLKEVNCHGEVANPLQYHFVGDAVWVSATSEFPR
jgi:hypothetical protein